MCACVHVRICVCVHEYFRACVYCVCVRLCVLLCVWEYVYVIVCMFEITFFRRRLPVRASDFPLDLGRHPPSLTRKVKRLYPNTWKTFSEVDLSRFTAYEKVYAHMCGV